jgi:fatty acid desaturase
LSEPPIHLRVPRHMRQRPIGLRTRIFAVIGVLWAAGMVLSAFVGRSPAWTGIVGVVFMAIAGYWLFTRDRFT